MNRNIRTITRNPNIEVRANVYVQFKTTIVIFINRILQNINVKADSILFLRAKWKQVYSFEGLNNWKTRTPIHCQYTNAPGEIFSCFHGEHFTEVHGH